MMLVPDDEFDAAAAQVAGVKKAPTLDQAAANVIDGQRTQLRTSLYGALDSNPDEAARAKESIKQVWHPCRHRPAQLCAGQSQCANSMSLMKRSSVHHCLASG
jgi:hypothetical protein